MNRRDLHYIQKHAECLNEAWCELEGGYPRKPDAEREKLLKHEISARVWAVIYLLQYHDRAMPPDAEAVIREADAYDGINDDLSDEEQAAARCGTH